jgi:AcrR family transcriptional regulator
MASLSAKSANTKRPRLGRPTRAQAERRQEELLDVAADLFLEMGYQRATLELIADSIGMTKRTIYSRYDDKEALFKATVQHAIVRMVKSQADDLKAIRTNELSSALAATARMRLRQIMSPEGLRLQRIINAESTRLPEIFAMGYQQVTKPVVGFLAELLQRHAASGDITVEQPELAATIFLSMAAGAPARVIVSGNRIDEAGIEDRIAYCVRLFLDGLRPR